jgi:hypothetical protein
MGISAGPSGVSDGLVFQLDAANLRSYSGTGLTAFGLIAGIGATLINGVGFTSSNSGSFTFDGTNDWIIVPYNSDLDISGSMTIESFIYPTSYRVGGGGGSFIVCKPASYYLELAGNGKVRVYFYLLSSEGYHESIGTVLLNIWSYIAVVRDKLNSSINIYINGILDRTLSSITGDIRIQQTYQVMLGSFVGDSYQLTGRIGNTKIYNRPLSATEIQQNFNAMRERYNI